MELNELKKKYHLFEVKYKLPRFEELNECFEIEKIDRDSEILLRVIRKVVMEKIMNSLNFIEMLFNPVSASRMYLSYLKNMSHEDRNVLDVLYRSLAELVVFALEREVEYDERKEAELINKVNKIWKDSKEDFKRILAGIRKPEIINNKREKSYFG